MPCLRRKYNKDAPAHPMTINAIYSGVSNPDRGGASCLMVLSSADLTKLIENTGIENLIKCFVNGIKNEIGDECKASMKVLFSHAVPYFLKHSEKMRLFLELESSNYQGVKFSPQNYDYKVTFTTYCGTLTKRVVKEFLEEVLSLLVNNPWILLLIGKKYEERGSHDGEEDS